jgi:ribosomal protein L10
VIMEVVVLPSQMVLDEKSGEVEEIKELLQGYKSIVIADLKKVRASQLQALK